MKYFDNDARLMLFGLRENNEATYADIIWALRYPEPSPKSSNGWPVRHMDETPVKAIRVVK